jgi:hypothetical protein
MQSIYPLHEDKSMTNTTNTAPRFAAIVRADDDDADGFSEAVRHSLEAIRADLSTVIGWQVEVQYGAADEQTEQWAAFVLNVAPWGPLLPISIFIGKRIEGFGVIVGIDPRVALYKVGDEEQFQNDEELKDLIFDTVIANFDMLVNTKRPVDHKLIALASSAPAE